MFYILLKSADNWHCLGVVFLNSSTCSQMGSYWAGLHAGLWRFCSCLYLSIALPRSFVLVHITHATRARINAHTHSTHARTYARMQTHIHDRFVKCKGHNVTTAYSCVYFFQVEFVLILKISCESWVHKNLRNIVIFTLMTTQQNVVLISMISWDEKRWQYPSGLALPGNRDTGYFGSIHWPWMWLLRSGSRGILTSEIICLIPHAHFAVCTHGDWPDLSAVCERYHVIL